MREQYGHICLTYLLSLIVVQLLARRGEFVCLLVCRETAFPFDPGILPLICVVTLSMDMTLLLFVIPLSRNHCKLVSGNAS